jgi:hypothetical protein
MWRTDAGDLDVLTKMSRPIAPSQAPRDQPSTETDPDKGTGVQHGTTEPEMG